MPGTAPEDLLAKLVAFDTTSHKSNMELIRFVADWLAGFGVASDIVAAPGGDKASLFATIGPDGVAGAALSGHTDVVPADGQDWDSDPFALTARGGRLHGRGTADMKAFLACALAAAPDFRRRALKTPIHFVFSYDEEIGCLGVRPLIALFGRRLPRPRLVIVGEPTSMRVVDAHKGSTRWRVEAAGRAAHTSMAPLGVNAITAAAAVLGELGRIEKDLAAAPPNPRFDPPYVTLQPARISGGAAGNIVPARCVFDFDARALPGFDAGAVEARVKDFIERELLPDMRRVAPEAAITVTRVVEAPPFAAKADSEAVALALAWAGQNETHAVSYATEAGLFQDAGAPSVVCGPGSISQAHTANEWIARDELAKCMAFMGRLADWAEA